MVDMKKLYLLLFIAQSLLCAAHPIDASKARQVALQFIQTQYQNSPALKSRVRKNPQLDLAYTQVSEVGNVFYVFNQLQEQGFVIVSADDRSTPVLGYTSNGAFDINHLPEGLKELLNSYDQQISYAVKNNVGRSRAPRDRSDIAPLIQTQWNQRKPYNNLCPIDPRTTERSVTGCGATAIAQLLYYHQYPSTGKNSISYEWNGRTYSADFSQVNFQWDKMKLTYDDDTPDTDNAVATLLYNCALSMKSEFTSDDTNSWFDTEFLTKYFGYKDQINMLWKKDVSDDVFENTIYQDLYKGLPVFCWAENFVGDFSHIFLIDGCNKDGLFHMNFGWGGYCDGYYQLTPIDVGWANMDVFQTIMYNIQPDIPGKWFLQTDDGRYFEMSSFGSIETDQNSETDLLLLDISGNIIASGFTEVSFVQTDGSFPSSSITGDANGDGTVDISDYIGVANHILGIPQTGFNVDAADVNKDGVIDISDYIGVANIILTGNVGGTVKAPQKYRFEGHETPMNPMALEVTYEKDGGYVTTFTDLVTFLRHGQSERYAWKPSSSSALNYNSQGKAFDISHVKMISRNVEHTSTITLPKLSSLKLSDVKVVGDKDIVTIDEKGQYKTTSDILNAVTLDGKPLYSCWASADSIKRVNKADLNALETAIRCLLEIFPLAADQTSDKDFLHLKDMVRDIRETHELAEAIDASIIKNGYFIREEVEPQLEKAIEKMISILGWDKLVTSDKYLNRSPVPPAGLRYDGGGMRLTINESEWVLLGSFKYGWRCKMTAGNYSRFGYTAIVKGEINKNGELVIPDYNIFHYLVKPQRVTSSFFDHIEFWKIENWDKVVEFYSQSYHFVIGDIEFDDMTWDEEKKENIKMDFSSNNDVVVALGPNNHPSVYFYNIIQLFAKPVLKMAQSFIKDEFFGGDYQYVTEHFVEKMLFDASFMSSINLILCDTEYSDVKKHALIAQKVLEQFKNYYLEEIDGVVEDGIFLVFKVTAEDKQIIKNEFDDAFWQLEMIKKYGNYFMGMLGLMEDDVIFNLDFDYNDSGLVIPDIPGYDL